MYDVRRLNMNAIEFLKTDHKRVAGLFADIKATDAVGHSAIFPMIRSELEAHDRTEETFLYPLLIAEGSPELVDLVREGIEEHLKVKAIISELDDLSDEHNLFESKLKTLVQDVESHVMEEEADMFTLVSEEFDTATLDALGEEMAAERSDTHKSQPATA